MAAASMIGCGGTSALGPAPPNISVSLSTPSVIVPQTGMEVIVPISIVSPSETALVAVTGLPGGIQQGYYASDTNPSGILTFMGGSVTPLGTYMPTITVHSAGAVASTQFVLVVTKSAN
jgi:hypothetical protein